MSNQNVSPAQRAQLFSQMTRQHWQTDGSIVGAEGATVKHSLNKVRLTNRVRVEIALDLKVTHASQSTYTPHPLAPFNFIRRISADMNNGFNPFVASGAELYMYSLMSDHSVVLNPKTTGRGKVVQGLAAGSSGVTNKVKFLVDLPFALNDRDPVSLLITQNPTTKVDIVIDLGQASDFGNGASGFTFQASNITITPLQESFSVPPVEQARPDIGILKVVQSRNESISGASRKSIKLPTGMTYRKLAWYMTDASGVPLLDTAISGNFDIVLNQADRPYSVKPSILAAINHEQFRNELPQGMWALDLSYQGLAGYGGMRDYLDTEQLTELWLEFNAPAAGNIVLVYEQLAKLQQTFQ